MGGYLWYSVWTLICVRGGEVLRLAHR